MKIKDICLALSVCVCSRLAIVMIICCVMALILKSKAMLPHSELLAMERRIVRKPLIVLLLPCSEGGVVVIPEGDFVLDAPIVINKHNVTFKGLNPGMRSNIDVNGINELLGPGGGSKLVARNAEAAIKVETGVKGCKDYEPDGVRWYGS